MGKMLRITVVRVFPKDTKLELDIYHARPSRPALRDEFREAGLVSKDHNVIFN